MLITPFIVLICNVVFCSWDTKTYILNNSTCCFCLWMQACMHAHSHMHDRAAKVTIFALPWYSSKSSSFSTQFFLNIKCIRLMELLTYCEVFLLTNKKEWKSYPTWTFCQQFLLHWTATTWKIYLQFYFSLLNDMTRSKHNYSSLALNPNECESKRMSHRQY